MNRVFALGVALAGAAIAVRFSQMPRGRVGAAIGRRMLGHMEHMMTKLPEGSPPRLIMSVLPQVRDQNEQIIAMLKEQNALLRELLQRLH